MRIAHRNSYNACALSRTHKGRMGTRCANHRPPRLPTTHQAEMEKLRLADAPTVQRVVPAAEVNPVYQGTGFPADATLRVVGIGGDELLCPCGGTHVQSSGEIGRVTVTKIKCKKKVTKVSYRLG